MPSLTAEVDLVIADMICFMFGMHGQPSGAEWCGTEAARRKLQTDGRAHFQAFNSKTDGVAAAHASLFRFLAAAHALPPADQGVFMKHYVTASLGHAATPRSAVLADLYHVINGLVPMSDIFSLALSELLNAGGADGGGGGTVTGGTRGTAGAGGGRLPASRIAEMVAEADALNAFEYSAFKGGAPSSYTFVREVLRSHSIIPMVKGRMLVAEPLQKQSTFWWWEKQTEELPKGARVIGALHATDVDERAFDNSRNFGWMDFKNGNGGGAAAQQTDWNFAAFGAGDNRKTHKCGGYQLGEMVLAYFSLKWAVQEQGWGYVWRTDSDEKLDVHMFPSTFEHGLRLTAQPVGTGDHLGLVKETPRPFKHAAACPYLDAGSDAYVAKPAVDKAAQWAQTMAASPGCGRSDCSAVRTVWEQVKALGKVMSSAGTSPSTNALKRWAVDLYIKAVGGEDMRTTFGTKGEWGNLDDAEGSGDQLEGSQAVEDKVQPGLTRRRKVLHPRGVVAGVKLVPNSDTKTNGNGRYTGMFRSGFTKGLIRLSGVLGESRGTAKSKGGLLGVGAKARQLCTVLPGIGIKAFVDGKASQDMVAMRSLGGQKGEWNFFQYPMTSTITAIADTAASLPIAAGFEDASACITHVGFLGFARFNADGSAVVSPRAPYQLVYVPKKQIVDATESQITEARGADGFLTCEDETKCPPILDTLFNAVKADTELFDVYAVASPQDVRRLKPWGKKGAAVIGGGGDDAQAIEVETLELAAHVASGKFVLLGTLIATSDASRSHVGDDSLFIRHQMFEDDALFELCRPGGGTDWAATGGLEWSNAVRSRNAPTCTQGGHHSISAKSHPRSMETGRAEFYCRMQKRARAGAGGNHLGAACRAKVDALVKEKMVVCGKDPRA